MISVSQPVNVSRISSHPSRSQRSDLPPLAPLSPQATAASLSALSLARSSGSLATELANDMAIEGSTQPIAMLSSHDSDNTMDKLDKVQAGAADGPPTCSAASGDHHRWTSLPAQPSTPLVPAQSRSRDSVDKSHHVVEDVEDGASVGHWTAPSSPSSAATTKFLVNTAWATAIIGRGGCNVRDLSSSTGCHVQLSDKTSFYPGTKSRVLLLRGSLHALREALTVVLRRRDELPIQSANPTDVDYISMLIPMAVCDEVVDGGHLQALERTTGATFLPTQRDKQGPFVPDRIVRVTGTRCVMGDGDGMVDTLSCTNRSQIVEAVMALLHVLLDTTEYRQSVTGLTPFRSVTITIPSKAVGVIMVRGG